ncbi:tyrosine recombinase XerD [Muribaculaceae bacterium]|uniref:site-specific integrase n=1 Tax=uncultured Bacteroides sp. TaxID=162156 RepID=UPI001433E8CE|nr:tyrosine recombinase XerD [Muribaculaceae bacterium]
MSETVKVVCYKSKTLSDGKHPLMVRVCKDGKKKYQSLGISILPSQWNFKKNEPNDNCPNRDEIRLLIQQRLFELQKTILSKKIEGKEFTASTLLENDKTRTDLHNNVGECFRYYINLLKEEERLRYAGMYEVSYNSFIKYAGTLDISFSDIDSSWLKKYEIWMLRQKLAVNTIGTRIRHLRVIFNLAIEKGIIKSDCYPFHNYKVSKMSAKTAKRALTKDDIMRVIAYKGKTNMEILAVDLFSFSYFSAGINFIDMAYLTRDNIKEDKLEYSRAKTKKKIIIPLQKEAVEIITKYGDTSPVYIFPIFTSFHKTDVQKANRLHKVLAKVNTALKRIGEELCLPQKLTTYVARHSFATVLKRAGVSTSIISESLGHSSEKITQIYLDSFENSQIEEALSHLK